MTPPARANEATSLLDDGPSRRSARVRADSWSRRPNPAGESEVGEWEFPWDKRSQRYRSVPSIVRRGAERWCSGTHVESASTPRASPRIRGDRTARFFSCFRDAILGLAGCSSTTAPNSPFLADAPPQPVVVEPDKGRTREFGYSVPHPALPSLQATSGEWRRAPAAPDGEGNREHVPHGPEVVAMPARCPGFGVVTAHPPQIAVVSGVHGISRPVPGRAGPPYGDRHEIQDHLRHHIQDHLVW
jgi:hypothetical protein